MLYFLISMLINFTYQVHLKVINLWDEPHNRNNNEVGDLFFFSNSENMDKLELYDNINPYLLVDVLHGKVYLTIC